MTAAIPQDVRTVAWRLLTAAGAGAIVGVIVGGVGGRLAMLVLRLTSEETVLGLTTDDGFEIGKFTTATLFLLTVTAGLGGATGAVYFVVRGVLPRRGRTLLWATVVGLFTGADPQAAKPGLHAPGAKVVRGRKLHRSPRRGSTPDRAYAPLVLSALAVRSGVELWRDADEILGMRLIR